MNYPLFLSLGNPDPKITTSVPPDNDPELGDTLEIDNAYYVGFTSKAYVKYPIYGRLTRGKFDPASINGLRVPSRSSKSQEIWVADTCALKHLHLPSSMFKSLGFIYTDSGFL